MYNISNNSKNIHKPFPEYNNNLDILISKYSDSIDSPHISNSSNSSKSEKSPNYLNSDINRSISTPISINNKDYISILSRNSNVNTPPTTPEIFLNLNTHLSPPKHPMIIDINNKILLNLKRIDETNINKQKNEEKNKLSQ